jgi:hypothetical protein
LFEDDNEVEIVGGSSAGLGGIILGLTAMLGKIAHSYWKKRKELGQIVGTPDTEMVENTYTFTSPASPPRSTIVQLLPFAPAHPYHPLQGSTARAIEHLPS